MDEDMELDEEQERGVDYDGQEDEQEEDVERSDEEREDEGDNDEGDDEDDGEGDDDEGEEDERRSPSQQSRRGSSARRSERALSPSTYLRKVEERRSLFKPSESCTDTTLGYQIEPMAAAPHSCHIHAMSLSLDGQTLVTGGSDGFVRKYDVNATMNGKLMLTQNVRHGFVEGITRGGVLSAFWPNEEHSLTNSEKERKVSVVHSVAIQQDALWGLSGSESGNIHLFGLRHDPGTTRHVFRKHKQVVSALAITSDDKDLISGGWDRDVHQWDLNTGQIVRSFTGHAGQISSISFRPVSSASTRPSASPISIRASATEMMPEDTSAKAEASASPQQTRATSNGANGVKSIDEQAVDLTKDTPDSDVVMLDSEPQKDSTLGVKQSGSPSPSANPTPTQNPANGGTDDPTEEELAFEAELNASLGLALDGNGSTKADGSQYSGTLLDGTISAKDETAKDPNSSGNLIVAGADQDDGADDDLFGGETPTPSVTDEKRTSSKQQIVKPGAAAKRSDSDGDDSLFGDGDEDADGATDADLEAEANVLGEAENGDEASSDEDMPLAGRAMLQSGVSQPDTVLPSGAPMFPTAEPSQTDLKPPAPSTTETSKPDDATTDTKKALPKPAFGGFGIASSFDAPISAFSPDVMMTSTLSGQAVLWDLRCPTYNDDEGKAKGVHSLPLPSKTSPWCQSAVFSHDGSKVYIGRKNESVDEWDLRIPRLARSLRLPSGSGPVFALATMPNSRHIICASYDNIRLWDTQFVPGTAGSMGELKVPFKIVAGHHGASVSSLLVDPSCNFLISASGDRGWMGTSTEAVILHDIKALY